MKINANEYSAAEVMKFVREWTELTQKQFAQSIGRSEARIQTYEQGTRNYTFETLLEIAQTHHIRITIEKMKK